MTAQRKRRGRKPGTVFRSVLAEVNVLEADAESIHVRLDWQPLRDAIAELRAALKEKGTKT